MDRELKRTLRRLELKAEVAEALATGTSPDDAIARWAEVVARFLEVEDVRVGVHGREVVSAPTTVPVVFSQTLECCTVELLSSRPLKDATGLDEACALLEMVAARDDDRVAASLWTLLSAGSWQAASDRLMAEARRLTGASVGVLGVLLGGGQLRILAGPGESEDGVNLRDDAFGRMLGPRSALENAGRPMLVVPVLDGRDAIGLIGVADRGSDFEPVHAARLERLARLACHLCRGYLNHRQERLVAKQFCDAQHMESLGRLAACLAHEFNNLLTIIGGQCTLLIDGQAADPQESLQDIREASQRAGSLVSDLLAYSRKQVVRPQRLNVNETLQRMARMLEDLLGEKREIAFELADTIGDTMADPTRIEQVVVNLVLNAREAMPGGGRLLVQTSQTDLDEAACSERADVKPGPYVVIAVSDTGRGIDPAARPHIFEPFYSSKPFGQKCGLGLASSEGIVKQAGGHLRVHSEVGRGTTFSIYLPLVENAAILPFDRSASRRAGETVLLVDDCDGMRRITRKMLERMGYEVLEATGGQHALQVSRAHQGPIHVLLTDVLMPEMEGPELHELIVRDRPGTRVLFISGYFERATRHHDLIRESFLAKPFALSALERKLREVLEAPPRLLRRAHADPG